MPAGTIALTTNSTTVAGTGTSFTAELKAGDFVYVTVGGAPYTLVVASITSNTQLTLAVAYDGPTTAGLAWNAVPASLEVAITQKILNDFASVARGRILDFQNWQKIYSNDQSVTVTRPDRTSFTGPSWGYLAGQFGGKLDKTGGEISGTLTTNGISNKAGSSITNWGALRIANDSNQFYALETDATGELQLTRTSGATANTVRLNGIGCAAMGPMSWSSIAAAMATLSGLGFSMATSGSQGRFDIPIGTSSRTLRVVCGSQVVTLNSSGDATVSYPYTFPTACLACIPVQGDLTGAAGISVINYSLSRTTSFDFRAFNQTNTAFRINYIAIGY